jgi:hypothetical protein
MPRSASTGGRHEGIGHDDNLRLDHVDHCDGVLRPHLQISARRRLMQHRQAGAAHPQTLRGRGDLNWGAGQHANRITVPDTGGASPPAIRRARS